MFSADGSIAGSLGINPHALFFNTAWTKRFTEGRRRGGLFLLLSLGPPVRSSAGSGRSYA